MYFPLFLDMAGKKILFIGGGQVTERRLHALLSVEKEEEKKAEITVVSPKATALVEAYALQERIFWKKKVFSPEDVDGADFVIAASDCRDVNEEAAMLCRKQGILFNDAGKKENCDFYFPGIAVKGDVTVGITVSGKDHRLTRKMTEAVRELLKEQEFLSEDQ